jgi:hypothetical protein
MLKDLNFHNSSFAFKILFNVYGKVTVWHTPCFQKKKKKKNDDLSKLISPPLRPHPFPTKTDSSSGKDFANPFFFLFFLGILEVTMNWEPGFTNVNSFVVRRKSTLHTKTSIWRKKTKKRGVGYTVALPFTLEGTLRQTKNYENSNISPRKNIILKKNSSYWNQNPSKYLL